MWARVVVGIVLCLVGALWIGQGTNVIHGSFMSGHAQWAVIGGVVLAAGVALLVWARRVGKDRAG
jgi:hypothetical protein